MSDRIDNGHVSRNAGDAYHLGKDLLGESLLHLVDVGRPAGGLNALLLGFSEAGNVPVHRVLQGEQQQSVGYRSLVRAGEAENW